MPASLNSIDIAPTSTVTNAKANYVITVSAIGAIYKNTIIKIGIPPEIRFIEYSTSCKVDGVEQFCSFDRINNNFKVLMGADLASTTFEVSLMNLVNPETMAAT